MPELLIGETQARYFSTRLNTTTRRDATRTRPTRCGQVTWELPTRSHLALRMVLCMPAATTPHNKWLSDPMVEARALPVWRPAPPLVVQAPQDYTRSLAFPWAEAVQAAAVAAAAGVAVTVEAAVPMALQP